jgi:hypothetical protein
MTDAKDLCAVPKKGIVPIRALHEVEARAMVGQGLRMGPLIEGAVRLQPPLPEAAICAPDLLYQPCREHDAVCDVKDLILYGRAPAVDDSHFHGITILSCSKQETTFSHHGDTENKNQSPNLKHQITNKSQAPSSKFKTF